MDNQINSETEWWHRAAKRLLRESIRKDFAEYVAHYQCYNQTRATVHQLKPKQNYYVDVFVRNQMTGGASRYWTANFSLAEPVAKNAGKDKGKQTDQILHDSLFTGVFLEAKNKYRKRMLYAVPNADAKSVYIYMQPCDGFGPVQFSVRQTYSPYADRRKRHNADEDSMIEENMIFGGSHDEQYNDLDVMLLEEVAETKTFEIQLPRSEGNESIILEFELNTMAQRQSRNVVLLATSDLNRFPFPRLPHDRAIRVCQTIDPFTR